MRWVGLGWALRQRHQCLSVEMAFRGYKDNTLVTLTENAQQWPKAFIDPPAQQYALLIEKYRDKEPGRIPLLTSTQQLWSQHKYSVLARSPQQYSHIGRAVAEDALAFSDLALTLTQQLRTAPTEGGMRNALQHMWGYVATLSSANHAELTEGPLLDLLHAIQQEAKAQECEYLLHSTALSEFAVSQKGRTFLSGNRSVCGEPQAPKGALHGAPLETPAPSDRPPFGLTRCSQNNGRCGTRFKKYIF